MRHLRLQRFFIQHSFPAWAIFVLFALGLSAYGAANVNGTGYTNDFSPLPSSSEWTTYSVSGSAADTYDPDTDVNTTVTASLVTTALVSDTNNPPAAYAYGIWSSYGYVQTRPTGNRYTVLMGSFVNKTGSNATQIAVSYLSTIIAGGAAEESGKGTRAYYSLNGAAGSWVNIPAFNSTASNNESSVLSANLALNWTNNGTLFLLWADDNSSDPLPEAAYLMNNFSLRVTAATPISTLSCRLNNPTNHAAFTYGSQVMVLASDSGALGPATLAVYLNRGASNTVFGDPIKTGTNTSLVTFLTGLAADTYNIFAQATEQNSGNVARSATNTFVVYIPMLVSISAPANGATFDYTTPITASVAINGGAPPWTVQYYLDGIAQGAPLTNSPYSYNLGTLFVGDHTVSASVKDAGGSLSNTAPSLIHITGPLGAMLMVTNGSTFNYGQSVLLTGVVAGGTAPYIANFYADDSLVATVTDAPFTALTSMLPEGPHTAYIYATDSSEPPEQTYSATNTFTIVPNPLLVNLTSPTNGQTALAGVAFTVTATATVHAPLTVTSVEFFMDGDFLGIVTNAPFSIGAANPSLGTHAFYALATDSVGRQSYTTTNQATFTENPLANDNFANRIMLSGPSVATTGNNSGAGTEYREPTGGGFGGYGATLWWSWVAPTNGTVRVDTYGSGFNTTLGIFTGTSVNALTRVAYNDNAPGSSDYSMLTFNAQQGVEYEIQVGGAFTFVPPFYVFIATGPIQLNLSMPPTVTITSPSNGVTYLSGSSFEIAATASSTLGTIQKVDFYSGNTLLGTCTSEPYSILCTNAPLGTNSIYAVATDTFGQAGSSAAIRVLVFNAGVTLVSPPDGTYYYNLNPITISAVALPPSGTITNVTFFVDGVKIGDDAIEPYNTAWSNVVSGSHRLTAIGTSDTGVNYNSQSVYIGIAQTLMPTGSVWRYLDDGSDQGTNWVAMNFDDSAWASGPAELGYGDGDEATVVQSGPTNNYYITTYFRREQVFSNIASFTSIIFHVKRDDGAVVYVNGVAAARFNMNSGAVNYLTTAPNANDDGTNWWDLAVSPALFVEGRNVLAVEIHQTSGTSSDISFDMAVFGLPQIARNQSPLVSLTSPPNNAVFLLPATFALSADASDADGLIVKVEFFSNNTKVGELTNSPYILNVTASEAGIYTFTAVATDNQGATTTSDPVTVTAYNVGKHWTAYNDHFAGPGTAPYATDWNVFGTTGGAPGNEGPLRDITTGAVLPAWVTLYGFGVSGDPTCGAPQPGTPAYNDFNGYIDFGSGGLNHAILVTSDSMVMHLFTGLDPLRRYNLRATVVGGNLDYSNRWSLFSINGADSYVPAHTANVLTSTAEPSLASDEAAMNTGDNRSGDVIGWDNIVPGPDGSFFVVSSQYTGPAAGNAQPGSYAYAPVAIELMEYAGVPLVTVTTPADGSAITGPTNLVVSASASAIVGITNVAFYANGVLIGNATSSPYQIVWTNPAFGPYELYAAAFDSEGTRTDSSPIAFNLVTPPTNSIPPYIASQVPLAESTVSNLTTIRVIFSQPVSGVDASDLLINDVPATNVTGSVVGTNYLFTFPQPPYGTVRVRWAADHGITDFSWPVHLAFDQTDPENYWNYNFVDRVPPTVASKSPPANASLTNLTQVTVYFSESVTGVKAGDFLVNSTPAYEVTGSGNQYTFSFSQPSSGAVTISWAINHGITDLADVPNAFNATGSGATWTYTLDARTILIQSNSFFMFMAGTNEASSPTNAWRLLEFDDSGWSNAAAPFYYGDTGYTNTTFWGTPLTDMRSNYSTIYLRTSFVVANAASITNLYMAAQSDDGFVAWINGYEVKRYNVTSNDIPYNGVALSASPEPQNNGAAWSNYALPNPQLYLLAGTNELAIHAINESLTTSSDFGFSMQLYTYAANTEWVAPRLVAKDPPASYLFALTNVTVTFSEPVTNVEPSDLLINGVPANTLQNISNTVFTFGFPQPAFGVVTISWTANHGIIDLDLAPKPFNSTTADATWQYTLLNANSPYLASATPAGGATVTNLTQISVIFNENVTGVDAADLLINGVPATALSGSGSNYLFSFPPPAYGTVGITWAANHGIASLNVPPVDFDPLWPTHSWLYALLDKTLPFVSSVNPPPGALVNNLTQITVTFSEPVAGVNASDLLLNGKAATGLSGTNATYTFTFPQPNATSIAVTWATNHGVKDRATVPNNFDATANGNTWSYGTIDNVPPSLASAFPGPYSTVRSLRQIVLSFDEPVQGLSANALTLNGVPALQLGGSGAGPYTFLFDQPATGLVQVALSAAFQDLASPPNPYGGSNWTYILNTNLALPTIARGPYLQMATTNSIVVRWRTSTAADSSVQYGLTFETCTNVLRDATVTTEHIMQIGNLAPNTKYYYGFGMTDGAMFTSTNYFFTTAPLSAKPTRIWVFGDNRLTSSSQPLQTNQDALRAKNAFLAYNGEHAIDLALNTGDLGGLNGTDAELQVGYFDTYPEILRQSVSWVCLGNHEEGTSNAEPYLADFTLPANGEAGGVASGTNRYYSFNYGNIHFIALDSQSSDTSVGGTMYQWLQRDLAANHSDWLIAFWHAPPYSITSMHNSDTESDMVVMRQNFVPLLESNGIDLVVNGHNHLYERTYLIDSHYGNSSTFTPSMLKDGGDGRPDGDGAYHKPTAGPAPHQGAVYATVGDSGAQLYGYIPMPTMYYGESAFGSLVLDVNGNRLDATFVRADGAINDHFTIIKGPIIASPELSIVQSPTGIFVSWPASADGYLLQASERVGASANWQTIAEGIVLNGNNKVLHFVPIQSQPVVFFRLQKP